MNDPDVAIVGAGFAGLAAAAELVAHGISVELFEATYRLGGRAHTVHEEVELGPEFVHGAPDATLELVHEGSLVLEPASDTHHTKRDGRLVEIPSIWQRLGSVLEPATHPDAPDMSAREYLDRATISRDDARLLAPLVEGFYAADLDQISIRSVADDAGGAAGVEGGAQSRIRGGYGRLVSVLAEPLARAHVPIRYGHVVERIDYSTERVRIDYRHEHGPGSAFARRVIVTLPIGVLQADSVQFEPDLGTRRDLFAHFVMGQVVKVVLCLRKPVWRYYAPPGLAFVHHDDGVFPSFWVHSSERLHQLTAWAGGPHARALAGLTVDDLVERVIHEFARCIGMPSTVLIHAIVHQHYHDYARDPFSLGAYSYTRVNGSAAADALAQPIADRLYIAGEATDAGFEGSVAGAIASGQRAARQIRDQLALLPSQIVAVAEPLPRHLHGT